MGDESLMAAFLLGTVIVLAVPGPSVVFVVARTVESGRAAGLVSVAGLETGLALHVAAATAGLSALVASSDTALTALRYLGAGYLLLLATRQLRRAPAALSGEASTGKRSGPARWQLFREAFVVDVLNPKTGLFFLAFLPQFVDPEGGPAAAQVLVLGGLVVVLAMVCDTCYVVASSLLVGGRGRPSAEGRTGRPRTALRVTSLVYAGLAVFTVLG